MIEIEKKIRLGANGPREFLEFAQTNGIVIAEPVSESDTYFRPAGFRNRTQSKKDYLVRLRRNAAGISLNLKKLTDKAGVFLEFETVVLDEASARNIVEHMGAEFACIVSKTRRRASYQSVEMLLDEVDGLGAFLEVSMEVHDQSDSAAAMQQIDEVISLLNANPSDIELRGYPDIILQNQGVRYE